MDIRPDYANVEQDGKLEQVDPDEVAIGSIIIVQPGEKVPIDGVIWQRNFQPEHQPRLPVRAFPGMIKDGR